MLDVDPPRHSAPHHPVPHHPAPPDPPARAGEPLPVLSDHAPAISAPPLPLFALFEAPYGMAGALPTFIPMILLRNAGLGIERAGAIASLCLLPFTFSFLYAALADFFLRRRVWLAVAIVSTALLSGAVAAFSGSLPVAWITVLLFCAIVSSTLISASISGLMASLLTPQAKSRVGAWSQLGNLGAGSLFLGGLLLIQNHVSRPLLGLLTTALMLLPVPFALRLRDRPFVPPAVTLGATLKDVFRELYTMLFSLRRLPAILLLLSPIGNGAITTVLSGLTREYHASAEQLAFANGWGGGLMAALGALSMLLFPARWNRLMPYAVAGIIYGSVSLLIATGPLRSATLVVGLLASNFVQGLAYAAYSGLVLLTIGAAGRCHSTRCSILSCMGNLSLVYMTALLSWTAGHFNVRAVALTDGLLNLASCAIFFAWFVWMRLRPDSFVNQPVEAETDATCA